MPTCARCGKELGLFSWKIHKYNTEEMTRYGIGNRLCGNCHSELRNEWLETNPPEWMKKERKLQEARKKRGGIIKYLQLCMYLTGLITLLVLYFNIDYFLSIPVFPNIILILSPALILALLTLYFEIRFYIQNKNHVK